MEAARVIVTRRWWWRVVGGGGGGGGEQMGAGKRTNDSRWLVGAGGGQLDGREGRWEPRKAPTSRDDSLVVEGAREGRWEPGDAPTSRRHSLVVGRRQRGELEAKETNQRVIMTHWWWWRAVGGQRAGRSQGKPQRVATTRWWCGRPSLYNYIH